MTVFLSGCLHSPVAICESGTNLDVFVSVWEAYEGEQGYPLFIYKNIDWMDVARVYYPLAEKATDQETVYQLIFDMLCLLQDPAIFMVTPDGDTLYTYTRTYQSNVDMEVLIENYLEPNGFQGETDGFGWCDPSILPYAYFRTFPSAGTPAGDSFDLFVKECADLQLPSVIIDIRMNPDGWRGSFDIPAPWFDQFVMGHFLDHSHVGAVYRVRIGPQYNMYHDFHPAIDPSGTGSYTGTVFLLVGGGCTQAAEDMAANMEYFPDVVLVGDTTAGNSTGADVLFWESETQGRFWKIGWGRSTLLTHGFQWIQDVGVPPDVYVEATEADFAAGVDPVLEYALEQIRY